jgi:hypothetical protein
MPKICASADAKSLCRPALSLEDAGRLVTRNELIEAVWPDTCAPPEVLNYRIADIRGTPETEPDRGPGARASVEREHSRRLVEVTDVLFAVRVKAHNRTIREQLAIGLALAFLLQL